MKVKIGESAQGGGVDLEESGWIRVTLEDQSARLQKWLPIYSVSCQGFEGEIGVQQVDMWKEGFQIEKIIYATAQKYSILSQELQVIQYGQGRRYREVLRNKAGEGSKDDQLMKDFVCYSREIGLIVRTVGKY